MEIRFAFLKKALTSNPELEERVFGNYPERYLKMLDELVQELYENNCKGIDVKMHETSDLIRFPSTVSELEFARYLVRNNMHVELLSSDVFHGRKAPDIYRARAQPMI